TLQHYARIVDYGNPKLRWEKTKTFNIGMDYSFLNNKLVGKLDIYSKHSTDLLASIDIAGAYGVGYSTKANAAEVRNRGIELEIGTRLPVSTSLNWNGRL